ncbi:MAG: site-2 protease family protein [Myxococcales bacterium]|jgi:regulator of sigma E protease|nr:site-2 protease family protein [Myxococcales bacterium]
MSTARILLAILGLAVLMIVHEGGHYLAARHFGMRVLRFSIGFGPTIYKHQPPGSPTVYQIGIIPFLAYVQIAGMNPWEENDPKDKGSYANASLWGRVVTIAAGPLANYFFASIFIFFAYVLGGKFIVDEASTRVEIIPGGPAAKAELIDGDRILAVNEQKVGTWEELRKAISAHPGEKVDLTVERKGETIHKFATPGPKGGESAGRIQVSPETKKVPVTFREAAWLSVRDPPLVIVAVIKGLTSVKMDDLSGPVGIVKETARAISRGPADALRFLGALSAYLCGFNLLPFPALDGGRLLFLGFEAAARRKPDAKVEAQIHAVGLIMLLALLVVVSFRNDIFGR